MKRGLILAATSLLLTLPATSPLAEQGPAVASEWRSYTDPLGPLGEQSLALLSDPDDAQLREEIYRALFSQIASGYFALLYADPQYPEFWPYLSQAFNVLGPNPDNVYYATPLQEDGVYKITGFRGSVKLVDFQFGGGTFVTRGTGKNLGTTLANHDIDSLHINRKSGAFEVLVSGTRPADYKGDWWPLPPQTTYLMVRQTSYDWRNEVDGRIAIQRLDRPAIKPRPNAEEISANLQQIATWAQAHVKWSASIVNAWRKQGKVNQVDFINFGADGGITTQKYLEGQFDLGDDEALIMETEVPDKCRYWSFQLTTELWSSIDWMNRQTSLNGFMAKRDSDGKFRAVISARDPGVPNWLDTAGYRRGVLQGRWEQCSSYPLPTLTRVKREELHRHLPADTAVVTAEARDAAIRLRREGAQLRRRW